MRYIYACTGDKKHPRREVNHRMPTDENLAAGLIPEVHCEECSALMERVPCNTQDVVYSPLDILLDWNDVNYNLMKAGSKKRFHPDHVTRPDKPLPQTKYRSR